jgi:threonine synthase
MTEWDGISLEEWVEKMLRDGFPEIVTRVLKTLPEEKKEKYRQIWKRVMEEKKSESLCGIPGKGE